MRTDFLSWVSLIPPFCEMLIPRQLSNVAEGLDYLHSCDVIHGDLNGVRDPFRRLTTILTRSQSNILVDGVGHARITDFGLAVVTRNMGSMQSASIENGHSVQWIAPEI